ncbi:hypothetical protein [Pseudofulvimonas gallinarii]|uniref:Secreted protein n=1 Tax=Pseudofulvimonas gallinarii TaxID=634155 RepID=A0A4R3LBB4_9GAMM|nr:hypothetical protein [Pseudofulvimonas gallinarii]TCS97163.1 hypothetical protein EDC25_11414 [Pseudofulvimonas gallinarii]
MNRPDWLRIILPLAASVAVGILASPPARAASDAAATGETGPQADWPSSVRAGVPGGRDGLTRLADIEDELLAALQAGDARAGCRLAAALADCRWLEKQAELAAADDAGLPPDDGDTMLRDLREMEVSAARTWLEFMDKDVKACEGIGAESYERYHDILLGTARLGDRRAMLQYAESAGSIDAALDPLAAPDLVRHPERLVRWKIEAPVMLYRALALGEAEAIEVLFRALTSAENMLDRLIPDDPVEATAMLMLARSIGYPARGMWLPELPETDKARAQARAEQIRREYFADYQHALRPPPSVEQLGGERSDCNSLGQ